MPQRTTQKYIELANALARRIDAAETRPDGLLAEYDHIIEILESRANTPRPLDYYVLYPANW